MWWALPWLVLVGDDSILGVVNYGWAWLLEAHFEKTRVMTWLYFKMPKIHTTFMVLWYWIEPGGFLRYHSKKSRISLLMNPTSQLQLVLERVGSIYATTHNRSPNETFPDPMNCYSMQTHKVRSTASLAWTVKIVGGVWTSMCPQS